MAAASSAEPAVCDGVCKYDVTAVSVTVGSHVAHRSLRHGVRVRPTGRVQSDFSRLCGSYYLIIFQQNLGTFFQKAEHLEKIVTPSFIIISKCRPYYAYIDCKNCLYTVVCKHIHL